jgi:hypothetical protein
MQMRPLQLQRLRLPLGETLAGSHPMNTSSQLETALPTLESIMFGKQDSSVFALLDGASAPNLVKLLYDNKPEFCCLYPGELKPDIAAVAPYLVRLESGKEFTRIVLKEGWGAHWGVFVSSSADLRALRDHFREFHKVELPDQRTVIFRYYDPRVLRIFLPVCNHAELAMFFGPVQTFIVEGESAETGIKFSFTGQAVKAQPFQLKKPG